jgi:hypothetical protein
LIGINPDYRLHVSDCLLAQNDGPMLEALKRPHGNTIHLPSRAKDLPDRDRLALRFERFVAANWMTAARAKASTDLPRDCLEPHSSAGMCAQTCHVRPILGLGAHGVFGRTWDFPPIVPSNYPPQSDASDLDARQRRWRLDACAKAGVIATCKGSNAVPPLSSRSLGERAAIQRTAAIEKQLRLRRLTV